LTFHGFGESDEPKTAWDVDKYTDLVEKFIEKMGITKLSLLGHSFGGRVIIKLCSRENLKFEIDKIVLVDSAGIKHTPKKTIKQRIYKITFPVIKKISPSLLNKIKTKVGSRDYRNATPMMRDILVKVVNEDLSEDAKKINVPVIIIYGNKDEAVPEEDIKEYERLIPDAGLILYEGSTHYAYLERLNQTISIIDNFIK